MAEAIGIGSGIIAFLTVSVQLTKVLCSGWDDFKEAPKEIQNLEFTIKNLEFYLERIQVLGAAGFNGQRTSELEKIWTSLQTQLVEVTEEFRIFGERLMRENASRGKLRVKAEWVVKNKSRVLDFDRKITGHLANFQTIWSLITHGDVKELGVQQHQRFDGMNRELVAQSEQIKDLDSSQSALHMESHVYLRRIETLTQRSTTTIQNTITSAAAASQRQADMLGLRVESLDRRLDSSDFVTKQFFTSELDRAIRTIAPSGFEPVYTTVSATPNIVRKSVSICFNSWNSYRLPVGHLHVFTGSKSTQNNTNPEASEQSFGIQFEFFPAPWLSNKSILASFKYHQTKSRVPNYRLDMYYSVIVPTNHQAFRAMENDDVGLLQRLLGSGLASPGDRDEHGWTLLHKAARWKQSEMCRILINEGADLNATDIWGRTPLHVACHYGISETVSLLIQHANDLSDPVISAAMRSFATIPSLFNPAINSIFFRLFEDFTGFEDMAPTIIATILCFLLSGTLEVQPKALRSWLLSRRPKYLDSAMPIQSLISYELQTMFGSFNEAQKNAMFAAVRHSCRVKSPVLFLLLSNCGVINSMSINEVLFSLSIASEFGNLVPLKVLLPIKTLLQKDPKNSTKDHFEYLGHAEVIKSVLDGRIFNRNSNATSLAPGENTGEKITPLMFAARSGDVDILRCLIAAGMDIQATDWRGRTALDHAIASGEDGAGAIIELLQEAQSKIERKRLLALSSGIHDLPGYGLKADNIRSDDSPTAQRAGLEGMWAPVNQLCAVLLETWNYLRQFTWRDIFRVSSGFIVIGLWSVGLATPQIIGFLFRHWRSIGQWFIYFIVAYSMYIVGKHRGQV